MKHSRILEEHGFPREGVVLPLSTALRSFGGHYSVALYSIADTPVMCKVRRLIHYSQGLIQRIVKYPCYVGENVFTVEVFSPVADEIN